MNKRLLDILCCPVSKTPLRLLRRDELAYVNKAIGEGAVDTVEGVRVGGKLDDGLITTDGKVIYRIEDDIPVLLPEEGIGTTQLNGFPTV
ncbi:MAG TPA: Trm112 family protein [Rhodanobacteraceae bacterium]|nr:Trm112 family protein [Rhodanobacteraceae bacterium]